MLFLLLPTIHNCTVIIYSSYFTKLAVCPICILAKRKIKAYRGNVYSEYSRYPRNVNGVNCIPYTPPGECIENVISSRRKCMAEGSSTLPTRNVEGSV